MHLEDDAALLRRYARARNQDAFAELVRRYLDFVYATALRQTEGRSDLASDIAQQAFIALARHAGAMEKHPTLAGWLYTTTRHLASSTLRSERTRKLREEAHAMHVRDTAPDADPAWGEIRPQLDELIDQLDDNGRDALVRRFFFNQKFVEIGASLHVSEDAARMRVERALERLRTLLGRRGITSTPGALGILLAALPAGAAAPAGLAATVTTAVVASAPLAPTVLMTAFNFVNTTKTAGVMGGVAALIFTGGVYLARRADATYERLRAVTQVEIVDETSAGRTRLRPMAAKISAKPGAGTPTVERFVPVPMDPAEVKALMERQRAISPEVRQKTAIIADRIRVRLRFHALYSILGLSRDEIDRFEQMAVTEHVAFGELIGTPEQQEDYLTGHLQIMDRVVTATVGERYKTAFRDYVATSALRSMAGELAANTYYTDTPLTAAQADRFLQVCVECRGPKAVDTYIEPATIDWPAVIARTEQFLAPQQMQALRAGLAKQLFNFEYERATGLPLRRPVRGL